jgi:enamine deaminase RidA (YjgF/YER057c/UK114 family)
MTERIMRAITGDHLPVGGHYTPAYRIGNCELVILSGVVSIDADGNTVGVDDPEAQVRQTLSNLKDVLAASGASMSDVVHVRVYTTDMAYRDIISRERRLAFGDHVPASTHVEVSRLARDDLLVEIEAMAAVALSG